MSEQQTSNTGMIAGVGLAAGLLWLLGKKKKEEEALPSDDGSVIPQEPNGQIDVPADLPDDLPIAEPVPIANPVAPQPQVEYDLEGYIRRMKEAGANYETMMFEMGCKVELLQNASNRALFENLVRTYETYGREYANMLIALGQRGYDINKFRRLVAEIGSQGTFDERTSSYTTYDYANYFSHDVMGFLQDNGLTVCSALDWINNIVAHMRGIEKFLRNRSIDLPVLPNAFIDAVNACSLSGSDDSEETVLETETSEGVFDFGSEFDAVETAITTNFSNTVSRFKNFIPDSFDSSQECKEMNQPVIVNTVLKETSGLGIDSGMATQYQRYFNRVSAVAMCHALEYASKQNYNTVKENSVMDRLFNSVKLAGTTIRRFFADAKYRS